MRQQHLDRHEAIQGGFKRLEDHSHPAAANHADNFIGTDPPQHVRVVGRPKQSEDGLQRLAFAAAVVVLAREVR
ncbi:MAG: hypothetical protein ACKV0T_09155 [Planctomycetales bacterium]